MSSKSPSPEQWHMWRRLRAAGCPIDCEHLAQPDHPYKVIRPPWNLTSNFFSLNDGVGIAFNVRIVASAATTICGFRLEAEWLPEAVHWVEPCLAHDGYCLHRSSGALLFKSADVLNSRTYHAGELKRGGFLQGVLVGETFNPMLPESPQNLEATLWIEDIGGAERPYGLSLLSGGGDDRDTNSSND